MTKLRTILLTIAAATASPLAAIQPDQIRTIELPASHRPGVDMELIDADALPAEPELAGDLLEF